MADDSEVKSFVKIWIAAVSALCYCHFIPSRIRKPVARLLSLLPVILLFIRLPLPLSTVHLAGPTVFYLVWLANFKLLLFAFHRGPLSSPKPLPLSVFLSVALLPINPRPAAVSSPPRKPAYFAVKALLLAVIVYLYEFRVAMHPGVVLALYCCHVYLGLELVLGLTAFLVRVVLGSGFETEPQFDEPYLATSLQDFWGRRWNLMVTRILRPTVYDPVRRLWGPLPAMLGTFVVSGLMHEVIYYYLTRVPPTWEVTWFFVLHGVCTCAEVAAKKAVKGGFRLHRAVSGPLTVAFVAATSVWLFFPQLLRNGVHEKTINEYSMAINFLRTKLSFY